MEGDGDGEDNTERQLQETIHNRKISEELIFSIFIDCIYIIFYKRVVTTLCSFLFNKHVIFHYMFLNQNFSFSLKVYVYMQVINKFYLCFTFICLDGFHATH